MSGEEGKTNDAVRGASQPAELCHLLSGCRCSAPKCPARPGLPSTTLPSHPSLHAQVLILLLRPCSSRDVHLILIAAWTMHRKGDALWLHQQEGSCTANARTSTSGNAFIRISKIWKKGRKRFLPEKSIKSTVTIVQETLQHRALGQTSRRKLTQRLHIQRCHAANTTQRYPAAQGACVFSAPLN